MNERIVATAMYCVEAENVTERRIQFRMRTDSHQVNLEQRIHPGACKYAEQIYGVLFGTDEEHSSCIQQYGETELRPGRLLAFPASLSVS